MGSLQHVCERTLTAFDQSNACQNSGRLMGKCVSCFNVTVYTWGEEGGERERNEHEFFFVHVIAILCHTCLMKIRWFCWLVSSCRDVFFRQHNKAKGSGSDYGITDMRCCWAVITSNMLLFIHMLLFDYLPLYIHTVYLVILLLCLCQPVTVLWLICRHMLLVNISSLLL